MTRAKRARRATSSADAVDTGQCARCRVHVPAAEIVFGSDGVMHCIACGPPPPSTSARSSRHDADAEWEVPPPAFTMAKLRATRGLVACACIVAAVLVFVWLASLAS